MSVSDVVRILQEYEDYRFASVYSWEFQNEISIYKNVNPPNIYLFKINNRNTRKRCEICSKLTIKTPEPRRYC